MQTSVVVDIVCYPTPSLGMGALQFKVENRQTLTKVTNPAD